jgi:hypothetical protein
MRSASTKVWIACADVAEGVAGLHGLDPLHQRVVRDLDQPLGLPGDVAGDVHPRGVAEPAVDDHGHVDVQDVAVLEHLRSRDAVTDDMVDRDAAGVLVALVADGGGGRAGGGDPFGDDAVDLGGGLAGKDMGRHLVQDARGQFARLAHAGEILALVDPDAVPREPAPVRVVHRHLLPIRP